MSTSEQLRSATARERDAYYAALSEFELGALWTVLSDALTPEPRVRSVPHLWRWSEVRPQVIRAGELVTAAEAERRVVVLKNPGLGGAIHATGSLYAGIQLLLPGEVARTHHHTPSAIRFVMEGEGAFTAVDGERAFMSKGDFLTTPNWTWHDHGNETDQPMIWFDGLDIPLVTALDAVFYEEYRERHEAEVQAITRPPDDSRARWGSGLRPSYDRHDGMHSPVRNYRWSTARAALAAMSDEPGSPYDGIILEYTNPLTGGPVLPTLSAYLQLLRTGERTTAHRHVASTVYCVAEGEGTSIVGGQQFDWQEGDAFAVPAWTWHEHASSRREAVLFSFSERPALRALGLDREEAHPAAHQS